MEPVLGIAGSVTAAMLGMGLVRTGWDGRRVLAWSGWGVMLIALAGLALLTGAWGIAVGTTGAMAVALLLLARAAWTAPTGRSRPARTPPSVTLPRLRIGGIARRVAVFLMVVPVGLAASALLAFGVQAQARRSGWAEADSIVLLLFLQPTLWAVLASVQMLRTGPVAMIAPTVLCAVAGLLLWWPL